MADGRTGSGLPPVAQARMAEIRRSGTWGSALTTDEFAAIRACMEELRRELDGTKPGEKEAQRDLLLPRVVAIRWPPSETSAGPGRVRQSGIKGS